MKNTFNREFNANDSTSGLQLLHLSPQPDTSFLPSDWRENDLEFYLQEASSNPLTIDRIRTPIVERIRDIEEYDGVVIGGASHNVRDNLSFFKDIQSSVREAIDKKIPVLGFCLGHQLMGHEFGATIEKGRYGPEIGIVDIQKTQSGQMNDLLLHLPDHFESCSNHADVVTRLPAGSTELAHNAYANQIVEYAPNTWGVQFHPERRKRTMRTIYQTKLEGEERRQTLDKLRTLDLSVSRGILQNYISTVRNQHLYSVLLTP
ncbi:hypothetical protein COU75_03020 [Candidatus Peregrinibacteria bacterium CG10_big_fil_rev_8_21_14_0_10_42_8]|nr:MAG: hypothetical protein COU75_03020 [Candidatus Peregrinibacteria bacterium CG10_big_fil_rev_8_21_14_0_10_42_8]